MTERASRARITPPAPPDSHERVSSAYAGRIVQDRYQLAESIGHGGMGTVWLADDRVLSRRVAVKVHNGPADSRAVAAFQREATAAARVNDPAVVRVVDFGVLPEGIPFIVMELVEGESLAKLAKKGPLAPESAVQLLLPIAAALARAHERGVVHCDIKPSNILLGCDGEAVQPKLIDFGIARLAQDEPNEVMGTPSYMSPEQVLGRPCDAKSDVWSFSAVLAELVLGHPLFAGDDDTEVLGAILGAQQGELLGDIGDPELRAILAHGLERDPWSRWAAFDELGEALAGWLTDRGEIADARGCLLASRWGSAPRSSDPAEPPRSLRRAALPRPWPALLAVFAAGLAFIALLATLWP